MDKSKYIENVKKLLALAKSTNPNEAALAMQRALKLMAEHAINASDVELSEVTEFKTKKAPTNAEKQPRYSHALVYAIKRAFGVEGYFSYSYLTCKNIVIFYGVNERPQLAAYAFDVLTRLLNKARKEFLATQNKRIKKSTKIARADQFCEGWVYGVRCVLDKFVVSDEEQTKLQQFADNKLRLKEGKAREAKACRGDNEAHNQGYLTGKKVRLNQGVTGAKTEPLAIGGRV